MAQDDQADDDAIEIEEIVVVGSRIKKDSFSSSSPIDIVLADVAKVRGITDVATLLQTTTVAAGSPQVTSASSTRFLENGGAGASTLSLRGLGANRTLILLNGRRAGPAGTRGRTSSFDLNVLPLAALERAEILKDGGSTIYGSDAVAGVVNLITKKGDGGTVDVYTSQPSASGGEEFRISGSWGRIFDRGNFRVTADYYKESNLAKGDRDYFRCGEQYIFDPDTGQRRDTIDPRTETPHCTDLRWGHVWIYDYQGPDGNVPISGSRLAQFDYDGDLAQFIPGYAVDPGNPDFLVAPPGNFPVNYDVASDGVTNADHPFQDESSLVPQTELTTIYAEGEIDISDDMTLYTEVLLNRRETHADAYRQYWTYIYNENWNFADGIGPGNGSTLSQGWTGAQWLSPLPITDHSDSHITVDYQRFVAGLRGDLAENWSYDLSYQYSFSDGEYREDQIFDDSITDQWFAAGSCVGEITSVRGVPCVDVPWLDPEFLRGNISPGVRDYLFGVETGKTEYEQWSVEAFVTGELFEMSGGTAAGAFGYDHQEDSIEDVPGEITLASNAWGTSQSAITAGSQVTNAVFAEIELPLLADKPAFDDLGLTLSGRYTDIDTSGDGTTYKAGLNWQINQSWRVRANRGTSFRTPALFELYLADQTSGFRQIAVDPCIRWQQNAIDGNITQEVADNCAADGVAPDHSATFFGTALAGGGLGVLDAETATSNTIGIIWQPAFAGLSISVDYFNIEIENEIVQLGAANIVGGCYSSDFFPNEPLCDLFERRAIDNGVDDVTDDYINVATRENRGWDIAAIYQLEVGGGTLSFDTQHTIQIADKQALFPGNIEDTNGELGQPEWVGRLFTTYDRGPWTVFWSAEYIDSVSNVSSFGGDTATYRGDTVSVVLDADSVMYHAFSVTRRFADYGLTAVLGVANAFDEEPPQLTTLNLGEVVTEGRSAFYSQYDWLGRRYFLNVVWDFDN